MKSFIFCRNEESIRRKVNKIYPQNKTSEDRQKRRELFHLINFIGASRIGKNSRIQCSERPDFVLTDRFTRRKIWVEVTNVLDSASTYQNAQYSLDNFLNDKLVGYNSSSVNYIESSPDAKKEFVRLSEQKDKKILLWENSGKNKSDKKILLFVTTESSDNGCPTTGHWLERAIESVDAIAKNYDDFFILSYLSHPKDGDILLLGKEEIKTFLKYHDKP